MNEKQLKDFLVVDRIEGLNKENKLLAYLYMAFTILFIDVHFFVTLLFEIDAILVFSIMIVMTIQTPWMPKVFWTSKVRHNMLTGMQDYIFFK